MVPHGLADDMRFARLFTSLLGLLTIGLAGLMVVVPRMSSGTAVVAIGIILIFAGIIETLSGIGADKWSRTPVIASGLVTMVVGLVVLIEGPHTFFSLGAIAAVWLTLRATVFLILAVRGPWPSAKVWLLASGIGNILLAALAIVVAISASLAHAVFGPSLKAGEYSAIPAISLLLTGISMAVAAISPRLRLN
jgi:uncharacterized membrane protein HdeD (DUF308 family)